MSRSLRAAQLRRARWEESLAAHPGGGFAYLPLATQTNAATAEIFHALAAVIHDRVHSHPHYGIALLQHRHSSRQGPH